MPLFVALYRAFAESLASENASRLSSMHAAEENIQNHLSELSMRYHQPQPDENGSGGEPEPRS